MKTIQSKLIVVLAIFFTLSVTGACITISFLKNQKGDGVVINLAGKQRMLTQKMSKEALAVSQGVEPSGLLEKTMGLFDRTLKGLISGDNDMGLSPTQDKNTLNQLNHVRKLWKVLNTNLDIVVANSGETGTALSYINSNNTMLLKEMNKAVGMLEEKASDPVRINLAGRQRMLTQKMSKEVIALSQGKGTKGHLEKTINLFDTTLKGLISGDSELGLSPAKDQEVVGQLNNVQGLWKEFRADLDIVITRSEEANAALSYINENNLELLNEMNNVVVMLEGNVFDAKTINLAGKQRMLTQKIVKETLGLVRGIESSDTVRSTSALFDKTLKGFMEGDYDLGLIAINNEAIFAQLENVRKLWNSFYENVNKVLTLVPEMNGAIAGIRDKNIGLLKSSNEVVALLEGKTLDSRTINLAGKQRMLTQKMVKEMLGLVQGKDAGEMLKGTSALFDKTLKGLISGDEELRLYAMEDAAIVAQLQSVQKLWDGFYRNIKNMLRLAPQTNKALVYITGHNVGLLKEMNRAVGMYEKQMSGKVATLNWITIIIVSITVVTVILTWFVIVRPLIRTLKGITVNLSESSGQMASATEQISSTSQSLSQGATEQAASLEETSASMEQMASVTSQNANNATEAARLVDMCSDAAEKGNSAMGEMDISMQEINASSKKIAEITKVIDGIAFQTNLLALNASVEAARAGEHGKGFAVVAEEVRNLAQRSASAAKDTTALIEDCVAKANEGSKVSVKCKESLEGIVKNVKKVTVLTKEIAGASSEQSEGINHVSSAVQQMDQVTQQNAASAEETASACEEMSAQAQNMREQVAKLSLQVGGGTGNGHALKGRQMDVRHNGNLAAARLRGPLKHTTSRARNLKDLTNGISAESAKQRSGNGKELAGDLVFVTEHDETHSDF